MTDNPALAAFVISIVFIVIAIMSKGALWWMVAMVSTVIFWINVDNGMFELLAGMMVIVEGFGFVAHLREGKVS